MSETELSPIKRALVEQRRLKARIEELERVRAEPIAVIGVGCRFPGASGPAAFWDLLHTGVDAISEMPASRWDVDKLYDPDPEAPGKFATRFGGYLQNIDQFDAHLFGISPREAATMDPQQRVLLEVTWEALEHAGLATDSIAGSATGVFVGIGPNDYFQQYALHGHRDEIDAYLATGNAHSVASGRISYLLGLHGPSISVDTACSSSLVAVHLACESIRSGSCDAAIAGGVGILLGEQNYISLSKARMMALDGRCKTFDAAADGFVRSEGCGMVVLKRLGNAQRDGDRILAVIRGSAVNQDGRSNGITAPNGPAQQAVIRSAHANAGTSPSAVSYVEAHGTGTVLGDPIEIDSLAAVLGAGRDADQVLLVGSVKTNIGHTEAAAGVAGLIKTVLALHHRVIPPNLHFQSPNPHIAWNEYPYLRVPTKPIAWAAQGGPRTAGVSAFGFGGTNAHLVVEEAPARADERPSNERPLHVLALSAKTDAALRIAARELARHLKESRDSLGDVCYSVNTGRAALPHRVFVVGTTAEELRARLKAFASGSADAATRSSVADIPPRVLFVFPARGAHVSPATRALYDTEPAFRAAIDECDVVLRALQLPGVLDIVAAAVTDGSDAGHATHPKLARFAVEYALAMLWKSWGVTPDAVLGEGVGDYVAATLAGILQLEDALAIVSGRAVSDAVRPAEAQVPVFSSATGKRATRGESMGVAAWVDTAEQSRVSDATRAAALEGFSAVVDLGTIDWEGIAAEAGELFVRGVAIDWRGFDRGHARQRVDVPLSPWVRERHWFEVSTNRARSGDAAATWTAVSDAAARQAALVPVDVDLNRFADLWKELDTFTTQAVVRTIGVLGLFTDGGESHTVDSAMAKGSVLPGYRHLLSLWLQRLARAGVLVRRDDHYTAATGGVVAAPTVHSGSFGGASDAFPIIRDYLRRCERQMAGVVTGRQGPLETLFPDGSFEIADFFYREWGLARYYNGILEAASDMLLRRAEKRLFRVLEIGAGTGGTASQLLPMLVASGAEYWFTDVSEHFFGRAQLAFADLSPVCFQRFDLDLDPLAQGIPLGQFDLVLASNAVHATKDLGRAIEHAKSLLAPGGLLMLYEVTTHLDWFEMSVALIEGWQHHADDLRGETPLLSSAQWERALRERGFDRVAVFPPVGSPAEILGHHIIMASASASAGPVPVRTQVPGQQAGVPRTIAVTAAAPEQSSRPMRDRLAALTHGERKVILQELVQRQVMRVMRLRPDAPAPATTDRLMSIGVDSLMAVELKKLLLKELGGGVDLPSTLIFDHPTIGAIAEFILSSYGFDDDSVTSAPSEPAVSGAPSASAALAGLSEAEVEAMLLEQLKGFSDE